MNAVSKRDFGTLAGSIDGEGTDSPFVRVPPSMLLRDVIYKMNELFATTAAIVNSQGRVVGWLTQSLLTEQFARDADQALRSPCSALLSGSETEMAA